MGSVLFKETSNRSHTSAPSPLLAIADSEGSITLHQRREVNLEHIFDLKKLFFDDEFSLCSNLSLDFTRYDVHPRTLYVSLWTGQIARREGRESNLFFLSKNSSFKYHDSDLGSLIVSLSNGYLCLLNPIEGSNMRVAETWHAHDYEPWIAAWNYWDPNVIYSGH